MSKLPLFLVAAMLASADSLGLGRIHMPDIFSIFVDRQSDNEVSAATSTVSPRFDRGPPPPDAAARMARYIVHNSNWGSMATISTRDSITGFPFANVFSVSDGATIAASSGVPYLYLTPLEMSVKDLNKNKKASLTMSLAQGSYCEINHLDPEDPRCAHVILTGTMERVTANTTEEDFAKKALFTRHPIMKEWPKGHNWFFAKLDVASVLVLDYFGGVKEVSVKEYFKAKPF